VVLLKRLLCLVLLSASALGAEDAVPGKELKGAIQHYQDALARARWATSDGSLAALYAQARSFGPDRTPSVAAQTEDFLGHCSPEQRKALVEGLAGIKLSDPGTTPAPELQFFLAFAKMNRLTRESQEFFSLLRKIYGEDFVPAYKKPTGPCTRFGEGIFLGLYKSLVAAESRLPHYRALLAAERNALVGEMTTSTCACGGPEEVERELEGFVRGVPKDPVAKRVRQRLLEIRDGSSGLAFHCPG
jgi:hypothetical protein